MWVLQELSTSWWGNKCEGAVCQTLESDKGCGWPWSVVSATGASGGLNCQPVGQEWTEVIERLSNAGWSRTAGHSPCAWWWLMRASVCVSPKPGACWMCMCIHWHTPSWTSQEIRHLGLGRVIRPSGDLCWYLEDPQVWGACGTSVWVLHVCSEHPAGPTSESGTYGMGRRG